MIKIIKKRENKNVLIEEKNYEDLMIYSTRYVDRKLEKILSLYYHDLMNKWRKY